MIARIWAGRVGDLPPDFHLVAIPTGLTRLDGTGEAEWIHGNVDAD